MAENEKEAYLALIATQDPQIHTLLDQGFEFVTNASKAKHGQSILDTSAEIIDCIAP